MTWVVAMGLLLALAPASAASAAPAAVNGNVHAAVTWSKFVFANGTAATVLLARDDDPADALTSGSIQGVLNAPLLLTNTTKLSPETATELKRLGAKRVIILGGTQGVSQPVEAEVKALGLATERVGGATPVETAVAVAARFFPNASNAVIAPVSSQGDSFGASTFAAQRNIPILLTETSKLSTATEQYLEGASPQGSKLEGFVIAGGDAAVSPAVADALAALEAPGLVGDEKVQVARVSGQNRFATVVEFDKQLGYADANAAPRVILLQGQGTTWANGLASAAQAGKGAATVLTNGDTLPAESATFLNGGSKTPLVCGPGVSRPTCDSAGKMLGLTP
ncbi:MAG: cell wall-binding repeat-containing protein [Egibacteraceae bacterium]